MTKSETDITSLTVLGAALLPTLDALWPVQTHLPLWEEEAAWSAGQDTTLGADMVTLALPIMSWLIFFECEFTHPFNRNWKLFNFISSFFRLSFQKI